MTLNGGRWETMGLVSISLPCPPPVEPLSPNISGKQRQWWEQRGGRWVVGWVQRGHYPQQRPGVAVCQGSSTFGAVSCRTKSKFIRFKHCFRFSLWRRAIPKNDPSFLNPTGLWTWVEFTRVCPGGSRLASARLGWLYNLRNVDERCLACPWWAREMDSVCYKWYTHTHTHVHLYLHCQMTPLSPCWLHWRTLILSWSLAMLQLCCEE